VGKKQLFYEPIKKQRLKTFITLAAQYVETNNSATKKIQTAISQRNLFGQLLCLSLKHAVDLKKNF
jgi:hypothetical protein